MIGAAPTLQDIVLSEVPEPVDLMCHEAMPTEEELGTANTQRRPRPEKRLYMVYCTCGTCGSNIKLAVQCAADTLRVFQQLFLGGLDIICPGCHNRM